MKGDIMELDKNNEQENLTNEKDYLETIEEMKNTMVPKEKLDKALEENKRLIKTIANGTKASQEKEEPKETREQKVKRHQEIVNRLLTPHGRKGIDLVRDGIEFRELTKELYGVDTAMIKVNSSSPVNDAEELAERMDKVEGKFKECLDNCDGTEGDFLNEIRKSIDPGTYPKLRKR